jgi:hypothetical protein
MDTPARGSGLLRGSAKENLNMSNRSDRLLKHLSLVEKGKRKIEKATDAKLLLEALCDQSDRLRCIERLASSPNTLNSLQNSFRVDFSPEFVNGSATEFLTYLQNPSIENFCNGQFVQKIVSKIVDPPTFWNAFVEAHHRKVLTEQAEQSFAWLLLVLLSPPNCTDDIIQIAEQIVQNRSFLDSSSHGIRAIGYRIGNILNILKTASATLIDAGAYRPGGRHDNDFENFREIAILPTPDEIASTAFPFYRRADEIYNVPSDHRPAVHYDNQFRLLREDLLAELRNDLQIARGQKKGRRSAYRIDGLAFRGVECGVHGRQKRCCLAFDCKNGLPRLSMLSKTERKRMLSDDRNLIKHQAFGCLINGTNIVAFATVDRNESSLLDDIPILVLDVTGRDGVNRILACASIGTTLTFLVVNTAVFAYEPILRRLQEKTEFPMFDCLLSSEPSQQALSLNKRLSNVVEKIEATEGKQLQDILDVERTIALDSSQYQSLLAGLKHSMSIIQGPPGIKSPCSCVRLTN